MTAENATVNLKNRFPTLITDNSVLWANIVNLFYAIEDENHPDRVRVPRKKRKSLSDKTW